MNENDYGTGNEYDGNEYYNLDNGESGGDPTLENPYTYQESSLEDGVSSLEDNVSSSEDNSYYGTYQNPNLNQDSYAYAQTYNNVSHENQNHANSSNKANGARGRVLSVIASAIIFGLVAATIFQGVNYITETYIRKTNEETSKNINNDNSSIQTTKPIENVVNETDKEASSISDVVESVMPSIVSINVMTKDTGSSYFGGYFGKEVEVPSSASGIIVGENEKELLIVTNNHVVSNSSTIQVTFVDEEMVNAVVKGTDMEADLAVVAVQLADIKSETKSKIKTAALGNSDEIKVGQMAIAIGNALGYGQSVTVGYISAKDREIEVTDTEGSGTNKMKVLQTDAAINPGNSGGALLNLKGEVVGINSVKYASAEVEGMGYAIPISRAVPIINELMNREILKEEEKGYLGISGTTVSDEANELYGIPFGVLVSEVAENGAAAEAGIQKGDIITAINDVEVSTMESLKEKVNSYRIGTEFTLTIKRNTNGSYEDSKVNVTLKGSDTLDSLPGEKTNPNATIVPEEPSGNYEGFPNGGFNDDDMDEFFNFFR